MPFQIRIDLKAGLSGRDAAKSLCDKLNGTILRGGRDWGTKDAFFPIKVPFAIWKTMTWDYSGVTARKCRRGFGYDIADIHRRLAVCRDEAEYRLQMEEMNRAYFDPSFRFAPNASLHCRGNENNPFWGWFRVDIAAIASGRYAVIWPLPEALANRVWGISPK